MLEQDRFDDRFVFSNEVIFQLTVKVNKHSTCIWGTEHAYLTQKSVRDFPKANVFCTILKKRVYGLFFFEETMVNSEAYLAELQNWLMELLIEGEQADFIFQQDGAPPHWNLTVKTVSECYSA